MTKNVIIDFDGVIHSYVSGWQGPRTIPDPPVKGAIDWLLRLIADERLQPAMLSTRSRAWFGRRAMKKWLMRHGTYHWKSATRGDATDWKDQMDLWFNAGHENTMGYPEEVAEDAGRLLVKSILWPKHKIPAVMQIDDRGFHFEGRFPSADQICEFKPWDKEE